MSALTPVLEFEVPCLWDTASGDREIGIARSPEKPDQFVVVFFQGGVDCVSPGYTYTIEQVNSLLHSAQNEEFKRVIDPVRLAKVGIKPNVVTESTQK